MCSALCLSEIWVARGEASRGELSGESSREFCKDALASVVQALGSKAVVAGARKRGLGSRSGR